MCLEEELLVTNPFSDLDIKYIPAFLLQMINNQFLLRKTEEIYELQHTSFAMPPSIYNFRCHSHLEKMRDSYVFVVYFVITDSLFYLFPIIISTFALVKFFQELQKSVDFHRKSTSVKKSNNSLWTVSRLVLALDCGVLLACLMAIIIFATYWLVVDSDAVFLLSSAHYLNMFTIMVITFYLMMRTLGLVAKISSTLQKRFAAISNRSS